jgi:predicted amidohydrolase YtcJ
MQRRRPPPSFAARVETRRGIIGAGRDADLVERDRDRPAGAAAITEIRVVATVVNGRVGHGEDAA